MTEPEYYRIVEWGRCKNCHQPIERRLVLGWMHEDSQLMMCQLPHKPDEPVFLCAEPAS